MGAAIQGQPILSRPDFISTDPLEEDQQAFPTLLRHRYHLFEAVEPGRAQIIYGCDRKMRARQNNKVMVYHLPDLDHYHEFVALLRALRSPYVANLLDSWIEEGGGEKVGYVVLERGGVRLDEYLDQSESLSDNARSDILMSISTTLLFLYQNGYLGNFSAGSFMQFGGDWLLVDFFDGLFPFETVEDKVQQDLFALGQERTLLQALVDSKFSSLQLPEFSSMSLGLMVFELFLSSSLFAGRSSQDIYELVLLPMSSIAVVVSDLSERRLISMIHVITQGHAGRGTDADVVLQLATLLQDHIMPSFRKQKASGVAVTGFHGRRRHYYSMGSIM